MMLLLKHLGYEKVQVILKSKIFPLQGDVQTVGVFPISLFEYKDMRTPDGKWIFPHNWDTHYVDKHDIAPTREFVKDAIIWKDTKNDRN
jgi:hypothetical protein